MRFFWIDIGYACFGILTKENEVVAAPPIAGWMLGKKLSAIKPWLLSKKAKVIEI